MPPRKSASLSLRVVALVLMALFLAVFSAAGGRQFVPKHSKKAAHVARQAVNRRAASPAIPTSSAPPLRRASVARAQAAPVSHPPHLPWTPASEAEPVTVALGTGALAKSARWKVMGGHGRHGPGPRS